MKTFLKPTFATVKNSGACSSVEKGKLELKCDDSRQVSIFEIIDLNSSTISDIVWFLKVCGINYEDFFNFIYKTNPELISNSPINIKVDSELTVRKKYLYFSHEYLLSGGKSDKTIINLIIDQINLIKEIGAEKNRKQIIKNLLHEYEKE